MSLLYKFPKVYDWATKKMLEGPNLKDFKENICPVFLKIERLPASSIILDLACGTGNVALWIAQQRQDVHVLGIDVSEAMLERARVRADEKQLSNVVFLHKVPLALTSQNILDCFDVLPNNNAPLDMITCSHGYSAMKVETHQSVFEHTLSLLKEGGSYVIMDIYLDESHSLASRFFRKFDSMIFGANDGYKKYWLLLKDTLTDFEIDEVCIKQWGVPTNWYVARGVNKQES